MQRVFAADLLVVRLLVLVALPLRRVDFLALLALRILKTSMQRCIHKKSNLYNSVKEKMQAKQTSFKVGNETKMKD